MRLSLHTCITALLLATAAGAEEPGVSVDVVGLGVVTLSGGADTAVTPGGRVLVDGPVAFGDSAIGRISTRLDVFALPGETLDLASVETFRSAEVTFAGYRVVGRLQLGGQVITTSIGCECGFATRLGRNPEPLQRSPRHYGCGFRFDERTSGAWVWTKYGRSEVAGDWGFGQWMVAGAVPLGPLIVGGDAVLSVDAGGRPRDRPGDRQLEQLDVVRLWVGVDAPELVKRLR